MRLQASVVRQCLKSFFGGDTLEGGNIEVSENETDPQFVLLVVRYSSSICCVLLGVLVSF